VGFVEKIKRAGQLIDKEEGELQEKNQATIQLSHLTPN